jgi:hypothetical protein
VGNAINTEQWNHEISLIFQEYTDRFWQVVSGQYPPHLPREIPVITSVCYYSLSILLGRFLRSGASQVFRNSPLLPYILDALFTFQVMACSLENGQVRKHYGMGAYVLALFALSTWHQHTVKDCSANPCAFVLKYTQKKCTGKKVLLSAVFQTCGGLLSYQYARKFWSLGFTESHGRRYLATHCLADLTVDPLTGLAIEAGGTMLETWLALISFTPFYMMEAASKTLLGCILTVLSQF